MGFDITGSKAMNELTMFHHRFQSKALKVDVSDMDITPNITIEIMDGCIQYTLGTRKVELSIVDDELSFMFSTDDISVLQLLLKQTTLEGMVINVLRWLSGNAISQMDLPEVNQRVESPEDGKDYSTVQLVVQINSSYETLNLYNDIKEQGWEFIQDTGGPLKFIGSSSGYQCWITPLIHIINGIRVLYIQPTSSFVNWEMVEEWVNNRVSNEALMISDPGELIHVINRLK